MVLKEEASRGAMVDTQVPKRVSSSKGQRTFGYGNRHSGSWFPPGVYECTWEDFCIKDIRNGSGG